MPNWMEKLPNLVMTHITIEYGHWKSWFTALQDDFPYLCYFTRGYSIWKNHIHVPNPPDHIYIEHNLNPRCPIWRNHQPDPRTDSAPCGSSWPTWIFMVEWEKSWDLSTNKKGDFVAKILGFLNKKGGFCSEILHQSIQLMILSMIDRVSSQTLTSCPTVCELDNGT